MARRSPSHYTWDPILGGELVHGKARLRKLDELLNRIDAHKGVFLSDLRTRVWEARQEEASRIGKGDG